LFCCVLVVRIYFEEKALRNDLRGYEEYTKRVKYRLIPFIW
jgi:protein-S-isoprenylcysteine O-methyltransferase Ste14